MLLSTGFLTRQLASGCRRGFWSSANLFSTNKNASNSSGISSSWKVVEKVTERKVPPLSNVTINSTDCPVLVCPADLQQYPDSDRLLVYLLKNEEEDGTVLQLVQATPNTFNIDVHGGTDDKALEVHVPVQSNINAFCNGFGDVSVSEIHSDRLAVVTTTGDIRTKNIRCSEIVLATQGGSVLSKGVLQGKINIKTLAKGSVECQKLQGPSATVESDNGQINIASDYCDKSSVATHSGNIKFGSLHRKCKVEIRGKGNLVAAGLDGRLQAVINQGNADVQISNLVGHSNIEVAQGDVRVQLGETDKNFVHLSADQVDVPGDFGAKTFSENGKVVAQFGREEKDQGDLKVSVSSGKISVERSSWIASLNLKKNLTA
ncbi:protein FAM185A-like [Neocloeon triangulifer]|uniref:protein FAM185A-like n=1 Tax=Neocloeon triangulifer TaxID=2078957 RepID=UPI00286F8D36|nr:protein FAM185A-like [Neocloeon triangulifer]